MRAQSRFKRCLETNEIPHKTVYYGCPLLRPDKGHQGHGFVSKRRLIRAANPIRRGIRDEEAVCKSPVGDLIVIAGVTPASDAIGGIGVPERAVLEIRRVCHTGGQFCGVQRTCRDNTECPVPVRLSTLVSAFLSKGSIEVLDIRTMPGQELTIEVYLGSCWIIVRGEG